MESTLVCEVIQKVPICVNLNPFLKLDVDDKVNRVGECLSKMKLNTKVALLYKF